MGTVFKCVADSALNPTDMADQCHQCARTNVPLYDYLGTVLNPALAADPKLAEEYPDVYFLCATCINSGNVARSSTETVQDTIPRFSADEKAAWDDFNRLPGLQSDWPLCCGTFTEFVGIPATMDDLLQVQKDYRYWDAGPAEPFRNFAEEGEPEYLGEISKFCCKRCGVRYYTDDFT
ncbi:CbrC family protein [Corticimicrobacter populi]|uniref:CbrC family protein n=1 Tax=Corticimicrobacter populi TaxID=2175229 RepID=A0A2V1K285_9BURK|nr:CbrC family protein [Corticimicrobacter populi]PWF23021.1 hypothetical protein DD235_08425 [Corticimicrobacter populi]